MNQQMSKLVTQALVIIIGVIYTYYQQHRAKIDAAVKDNQAAKTALDIVNKTAVFVVHKLEAGDLDNKDKQVQAVKLVQSTLQTLGLPVLGDEVIAGAVESAVSAMHLAYDTQKPAAKTVGASTIKIDASEVTKALEDKLAEITALENSNEPIQTGVVDVSTDEQGGGPMSD